MTKKIFRSIIVVTVFIALISLVIIIGFLNTYFSKKVKDELHIQALYVAQAVEVSGEEFFEDFSIEGNRITWVDSTGKVLFDSDVDATTMENHASREEFQEAFKKGSGYAVRYSSTIMQQTINYTVLLNDNSVIRVSNLQLTIFSQILGMFYPIIVIFIIAIIISLILASKISKNIVRPINNINLDNLENEYIYDELSPFIRKIHQQNNKIQSQIDELKYSQEQFELITENMNEGIIIANNNSDILTINSSALTFLDIDVTHKKQSLFTINRQENFRKCVESAICGENSEEKICVKDRIYSIMASPAIYGNSVEGIVIFILDITEREQSEILRREFTSNVSHELKTPLTSIYGISDMLANGIVKTSDVKGFGKNIRDEAGRLITLIDDIIAISKLDENSIQKEIEVVDLYEMTSTIIERLSQFGESKNVKLSLSGEHLKLNCVRTIIDEVIYNICDNAIKYNNNGGFVKVNISNVNNNAVITVEDDGIGIENQYLNRIFERFFRADKSHSKKIGGTGLGLSIVKHGVKFHNGTVDVESKIGKGTTFIVRIPLN